MAVLQIHDFLNSSKPGHLSDYGAEVAHAVNEELPGDILLVSLKLKGNPIGMDFHTLGDRPFEHHSTCCLKLMSHLHQQCF